ncbi:DUF4105 domain-containing protein [Luteimonas viscosa]|uniref:DUF4105 domain-containing protein n=1 Tax=Luteimonas viscosa TaxID=1132694 RepID=A0A5D4XK05_9GAMM|nr:DUF4105 domain-containing protein [Luteimonas viscosa]TYT24986.1 DUF4105 domain-containing protein [Luteimonas viscosa]
MRGLARPCLLAGLLACAAQAQASLRLEIDPAGLSPDQTAATRALVDQALGALPAAFRERLDRTVVLRWRDDLPRQVHGRTRNGRVDLRRSLLDDWMSRDVRAGHADPSARAALAAILHELAHVYDRSPRGGLSRDARLLDLAGWPVRPLRLGLRVSRNDMRDRSPDAYELHSPAEFVAVNLEHFLLDPGYACRRPALHRYFASHFATGAKAAAEDCAQALPFVAAADDAAALRMLDIDPARIQSVDYLFAEANERPMSRWGHSMLRLVVCAPGRARGPACRFDLQHHVVLSFRAFVDDVQISSWRGLTGSYPSRLFVLPLGQVVDEYTKVELRGLRSIPLRLDEAEIAGLLGRAAQVHWSYDGRYYFVGNNCAVETWKLLNDGVPRLARAPLRSITPTGLLRRLQREGIADASVLDDPAAALRDGYRFESLAGYFAGLFAIADARLDLPVDDAQAWFALDPATRTAWLERGDLRASAALLVLEQAALRREQAQAREALKQRFLRGDEDLSGAADALRELLADGAYAGRPSALLPDGYGLPQGGERKGLAVAVAQDDARLRGLRDGLHARAHQWLPETQRGRLERVEANLVLAGDHLRRLAEAASP